MLIVVHFCFLLLPLKSICFLYLQFSFARHFIYKSTHSITTCVELLLLSIKLLSFSLLMNYQFIPFLFFCYHFMLIFSPALSCKQIKYPYHLHTNFRHIFISLSYSCINCWDIVNVYVCITLQETAKLCSKVTVLFYKFLPAKQEGFSFCLSSATFHILQYFKQSYGHSNEFVVGSHCSFIFIV